MLHTAHCFIVIVTLSVPSSSAYADLKRAEAAYEHGDYRRSSEELSQLARDGDAAGT